MILIVLRDHGGEDHDFDSGDEENHDEPYDNDDDLIENDERFIIPGSDMDIEDDDLKEYFIKEFEEQHGKFGKLIIVCDFCYSGGFIDDCKGSNKLILSSQVEGLKSYRYAYQLYNRLRWDYTEINTGAGAFTWEGENADSTDAFGDGNGRISVEEAHDLASAFCTEHYDWVFLNGNPLEDHIQHPQINDQIEGETYLWY